MAAPSSSPRRTRRSTAGLARELTRTDFAHDVCSAIHAAVEESGAQLLFLPAYSPDLNPIEHAFAKVKPRLRRAAARSFDALVGAVGEAIDAVSPADARRTIEAWRRDYNRARPHSALGYRSPEEFRQAFEAAEITRRQWAGLS